MHKLFFFFYYIAGAVEEQTLIPVDHVTSVQIVNVGNQEYWKWFKKKKKKVLKIKKT